MSGALTVPFGLAALFTLGHPKTYFIVLAFLALLAASAGAVRRNLDLRQNFTEEFCRFFVTTLTAQKNTALEIGRVGRRFVAHTRRFLIRDRFGR